MSVASWVAAGPLARTIIRTPLPTALLIATIVSPEIISSGKTWLRARRDTEGTEKKN
jgi:hypothetical protein